MNTRPKINDAHLLVLLPQSLKDATAKTAEGLGMSTSEFVRGALLAAITTIKIAERRKELTPPAAALEEIDFSAGGQPIFPHPSQQLDT